MEFTPSKLNLYLLKSLPSAYFCGVRVNHISKDTCIVKVKHKWFNQNPFKSMYFAVQNMAAELTTGVLVMQFINNSNKRISMLVISQKSTFTKKATGIITFKCTQGGIVEKKINEAIRTKEGVTFWMQSEGVDEKGDLVGTYDFEWTLKVK